MGILNPGLYASLVKRFGEVHVISLGQPMRYHILPNKKLNWKDRIVIPPHGGGEYYTVCCPFCKDRRFRLYINHRWNTTCTDSVHGEIEFGGWLAVCYNERCRQVYTDLKDQLKSYIYRRTKKLWVPPKAAEKVEFKPVTLPGSCVPIDKLDASHPAIQYMEGRGFNIDYLSKYHAVHFCWKAPESSNYRSSLVENRVIFPIYREGVCIGWQARMLGSPPNKKIPKYYTMPGYPVQWWLYGYDAAKQYPYGVLVEGIPAVIRLGPPAVALLGKYVSAVQSIMMQEAWDSLIIALDPDVYEDGSYVDKYVNTEAWDDPFGNFRKGKARILFPTGKDPADFPRKESWRIILSQAKESGLNVELA